MTLLFSLLLTVSAMFTVDNINFTITDNEATVVFSPEAKGEVTIPATIRYNGVTCPVVAIADSAFFNLYQVTGMTLPRSIKSIGGFAFFSTSVNKPIYTKSVFAYLPMEYQGAYEIPKGITEITAGAFCGCGDLTSVVLPKKLAKIGNYAFYASGVTTPVMTEKYFAYLPMEYKGAFTIPEGVTTIVDGACMHCLDLTRINIPSTVTYIGKEAFRYCSNLDSVVIPEQVKAIMPYTFDGCKKLIYLSLPSRLDSIGVYAFNWCVWLSRIDFSKTVIKAIGEHAFYNCMAIQKADLQEGLERIGDGAFDQCNDLKEVTIPKTVTEVGILPFAHTKINVPLFSDNVFIRLPESTTGVYVVPEGITTIAPFAFSYCQKLESVTLPSTLQSIGKMAFRYSSIKSIAVPESVAVDETVFEGCKYLKR